MNTVGVVVGTFGDPAVWNPLARRAIDSVLAQTCKPDDWVHVHAQSLQEARNRGAELMADHRYLIFLDADDELHPNYVEAMTTAASRAMTRSDSRDFLFRPITQGVHEDGSIEDPQWIPVTDFRVRNCAVIGTMCPTDLFLKLGGFQDYPVLEDWALWRAMTAAGARLVDVEAAIYRIFIRTDSRNAPAAIQGDTYRRILRDWPL